jgi:hypothetical protein
VKINFYITFANIKLTISMKINHFTSFKLFSFLFVLATAFLMTSCKDKNTDDDNNNNNGGTGVGPKVTLYEDILGGDYWTSKNVIVPIGRRLRFGMNAEYDKGISHVKAIRKVIQGPGSVSETVILDKVFDGNKFPADTATFMIMADGPVAQQVLVFTFIATGKDGSTGEISIEVRPDITVGERQDQALWNRNANGAYNLTEGVSINLDQDSKLHDIKLSKSGNSFKLISGNNSKFKMYKGTTLFKGFNTYQVILNEWNKSGNELNETFVLTEEPSDLYDFVLVKSNQNGLIYVIDVFEINDDHIYFDVIGENL